MISHHLSTLYFPKNYTFGNKIHFTFTFNLLKLFLKGFRFEAATKNIMIFFMLLIYFNDFAIKSL